MPGGRANLEEGLKSFDASRRDALRDLVTNERDPQLERAVDLLKGVNLFSKRASNAKPANGSKTNAPIKPLN
jgi:hypothetical protein